MDCHDAKERILEGREGAAVRRHVERCEDCGAYARELAGGGRQIARAFLAVPPSPGFEDRVAARVRTHRLLPNPWLMRCLSLMRRPAPSQHLAGEARDGECAGASGRDQ